MNKYRSLVNGFPANELFTMLSVWHVEVDMFLPWTPPLQGVAPVFFYWPTPITLPYKWHSSHPHRAAFSSWLPCFFFSESPSSSCSSWSLILSLVINSNFLFLFVYLLVCVCVCVLCLYVCTFLCMCAFWYGYLWRPEELEPRPGITRSCEPPDEGAGNETLVLWENRGKCLAVSPAPLSGLRSFLWLFYVKSSVNLPQACLARQAFIWAQHTHVISMQITKWSVNLQSPVSSLMFSPLLSECKGSSWEKSLFSSMDRQCWGSLVITKS